MSGQESMKIRGPVVGATKNEPAFVFRLANAE